MASRKETVLAQRRRYEIAASREERSRILDEVVRATGYHRKHAVRLLRGEDDGVEASPARRRRVYDDAFREALVDMWESGGRACGKRLREMLPELVREAERHRPLPPDVRRKLLAVSPATIDRLLAPAHAKSKATEIVQKLENAREALEALAAFTLPADLDPAEQRYLHGRLREVLTEVSRKRPSSPE